MVVNLPPSPHAPMTIMESWVLATQLPTFFTHFCEMAMEIEASHWLATPWTSNYNKDGDGNCDLHDHKPCHFQ
jgi:hypothetical protein